MAWHQHDSSLDRAAALRRAIGCPEPAQWQFFLAQIVGTNVGYNARADLRKVAVLFVAKPELGEAFEAACRLDSNIRRGLKWLRAVVAAQDPTPKKTTAELRAAQVAKRAAHARAKLAEATRKLAIAERLVARWDKRVRYYKGKGL